MSEFDKLREGNDFAAQLLRAGLREQPSAAGRRRAEQALGLSAAVVGGATLTSSTAGAALGAGVAPGSQVGLLVFAKWLSLGVLGGMALAGGATLATRPSAPKPSAPSASAAVLNVASATSSPVDPPTAAQATEAPEPETEPQSDAKGRPSEPARSQRAAPSAKPNSAELEPAPAPVSDAQALSQEIRLLERVRAKLRAGDSGAALVELDSVRGGVRTLAMEADLLRVEALLAHGERGRAEELASELERRNPGGGQNFRLKRLFGAK